LKATTIRNYIRSNKNTPLNELKKRVIRYIYNEISKKMETKPSESIIQNIETLFDRFWRTIDFHKAYIDLITNPQRLIELSKGNISDDEAKHFAIGLSAGNYICDNSDLAALSYLDHLLNRIPNSFFQHVVVDEGQDVTPLEYFLLSLHSSNQSFTVLGDLAQSVIPHRGIMSWSEVGRLFPKERIQRMTVNTSYRSTNEITHYQNQILGKVESRTTKAIPVGRHGEKPQFIKSKTYEDMIVAIINDIKSLQKQSINLIAVLSKTERESNRLVQELKERGITALLLDEDSGLEATVLVASIHQVKGLEFDAVVLCNARDYNYPDTWTNNRLLYLAVTRASQYLYIHWFGNLAKILIPTRGFKRSKE